MKRLLRFQLCELILVRLKRELDCKMNREREGGVVESVKVVLAWPLKAFKETDS